MLQVQNIGAFVRVLLPIRLTGGYSITVGTWLAIQPDRLRHVYEVWWEPEYSKLHLDGFLANAVPPWAGDVFGAPASAVVRDPDQVPYLTASKHHLLSSILSQEWPHDAILAAFDGSGLEG